MGAYSPDAPEADPAIGEAAMKSAETGEKMLGWMKDQAKITNKWAATDRDRYQKTFVPLQDEFIKEAETWDSKERLAGRANEAAADVRLGAKQAGDQRVRQAMAMGVNPASGRFANATAKAGTDTALAVAGARNLARRTVQGEADAKMASAINLGQGLGVNPGTSMGLSNGALQAGGSAAMSGYGQQGSLLNTQYQNQVETWKANQGGLASVMGAAGSILGAIPW